MHQREGEVRVREGKGRWEWVRGRGWERRREEGWEGRGREGKKRV